MNEMTSSQSHQADVGPHKHVRLLSRTSSFYPQQRRNCYICWATISCCCLGSLIAIATIVVAVAGVIIPLRDDIDAQVCKVRLCSTQAEGACPATSSPVGETLNVLVDIRVYNPTVFKMAISHIYTSATLEDLGDGAVPADSADAIVSTGAMAGCVSQIESDVVIATKEWGDVVFYCEVALDSRTGTALKRLNEGDDILLSLGYSVGGKIADMPASAAGSHWPPLPRPAPASGRAMMI